MFLTFIFQKTGMSSGKKITQEYQVPLWGQPSDLQELIYLLKDANSEHISPFLV